MPKPKRKRQAIWQAVGCHLHPASCHMVSSALGLTKCDCCAVLSHHTCMPYHSIGNQSQTEVVSGSRVCTCAANGRWAGKRRPAASCCTWSPCLDQAAPRWMPIGLLRTGRSALLLSPAAHLLRASSLQSVQGEARVCDKMAAARRAGRGLPCQLAAADHSHHTLCPRCACAGLSAVDQPQSILAVLQLICPEHQVSKCAAGTSAAAWQTDGALPHSVASSIQRCLSRGAP